MVLMSIVAPMDLKQDSLLEVEVNGKICSVKCPRDVTTGEIIEIDVVAPEETVQPHKPSVALPTKSSVTVPVHEGEFKYELCGCCDGKICCKAMWWATSCVQCIPFAQLLNRFRWSPCASPTKMSRSAVFTIIVSIYVVFYICNSLYSTGRKCEKVVTQSYYSSSVYVSYESCTLSIVGAVLYLVALILSITILVMLVRVRMAFRNHYKITGNCCADFCTMLCCTCCSTIQMLRQTHDEDEHKYSCCSCMTGLKDDAPEIV